MGVSKDSKVKRRPLLLTVIWSLALLLFMAIAGCGESQVTAESALSSSSGTPMVTPSPETSWLTLPELPPSATQADFGAEIYRLVCRDCHGDRGQGLTDEWRATWAPEDQNCWQSKCHATNHLPEGFIMPRVIPGLIGPDMLPRFETSLDLFEYMRVKMPFHNPGSLLDEEYWQLTAYILRESDLAPVDKSLDRTVAAKIQLHQDIRSPVSTQLTAWPWPWIAMIALIVGGLGLVAGRWLWGKR